VLQCSFVAIDMMDWHTAVVTNRLVVLVNMSPSETDEAIL